MHGQCVSGRQLLYPSSWRCSQCLWRLRPPPRGMLACAGVCGAAAGARAAWRGLQEWRAAQLLGGGDSSRCTAPEPAAAGGRAWRQGWCVAGVRVELAAAAALVSGACVVVVRRRAHTPPVVSPSTLPHCTVQAAACSSRAGASMPARWLHPARPRASLLRTPSRAARRGRACSRCCR